MDKKAIKILLGTFKKSQDENLATWFYWDTYRQHITEADFMYAKAQGVMFDREQLSHPAICGRIKKAVDTIDRTKVVNAFIHSLSTRRLVYRSFLSSYCMGKNLPAHDFTASAAPNESICAICGLSRHAINRPVDYNPINYFKYKHGSCPDDLISVLFDVEQFSKLPAVTPTDEDRQLLNDLKTAILTAAPNDRVAQLKKRIAKVIPSNDEERLGLLEILGVIGILHDEQHVGYADAYIPYPEREHRPIRNDDAGYPVRWWQGKFGVDEEKWAYWFGDNSQ